MVIKIFLSLIFLSLSCLAIAEQSHNDNLHQWNESEVAALKRLSIQSRTVIPDNLSNAVQFNPKAAELGHFLFFDKTFSLNGKISCSSCHHTDKYFTDGLTTSKGIATVNRNAPTIVGISASPWFFHDGRADSLWSQALEPLENTNEHGGNRSQYAHIIYNSSSLKALYENVFGAMPDITDLMRFPLHAGPVNSTQAQANWNKMALADKRIITQIFVNMGKAIAAYETLLKPAASRFDDYVSAILSGDINKAQQTLSVSEVAGLRLFLNKGNCIICHNGSMFSDFGFHNIATPPAVNRPLDWGRYKGVNEIRRSPFNCTGQYNDASNKNCDELKYMVIEKDHTIGAFRTPSLRNVSKTAPYMHAGQYKNLEQVIKHYVEPPGTKVGKSDILFIPIKLDQVEMAQIKSFLLSLDSSIDVEAKWLSSPKQ